jgi:hypothetical protein
MKKIMCFCFLTVFVLLFNSNTATAQCGQSGNTYYCQSISPSVGNDESWFDVWEGGNGYVITVYLEVYEENNPHFDGMAFADVAFEGFYWSQHIYGGNFQDSFIAAASEDGTLELSTYANGGEARIQATW